MTPKQQFLKDTLKFGEVYAGIIIGQNGEPDYHLILMVGEKTGITRKAAAAWAKKYGGQLPTRRELRLLWVNAADAFAKEWYWSGEQHAAGADCAWCQHLFNGYLDDTSTRSKLHARAVRRVEVT